jgi:transposase
VAKEAFKRRAELVERSFALTLDRGGMRRSWLRGRDNLHKRYLVREVVHMAAWLNGSGVPSGAVGVGLEFLAEPSPAS